MQRPEPVSESFQQRTRCDDVYAVVVTFNPDMAALRALLDALLPQVALVLVVDNASSNEMRAWQPNSARLLLQRLDHNRGIASAQNVGIDAARQFRARYVLLCDQDSIPAADMVSSLRAEALRLEGDSVKLAAVGPRYVDARQHSPSPFTRTEGLRMRRLERSGEESAVEVDHLIASGCLIPLSTLSIVGLMLDQLFIDYVDTEWGLRARHHGYRSFGVFTAELGHSLGGAPIRFRGKEYPSHSALRHYYMARNALWLYRQRYVPLNWRIVDAQKLVLRLVFYIAFGRPRRLHLRMIARGLADGLRSRLGPASA